MGYPTISKCRTHIELYSSIKLVNLQRVRHVKCQANIRVVSTTTRTSTMTQTYTPQMVDACTGDLSINNYNTDNSTVFYSMYVSKMLMFMMTKMIYSL